MSARFGASFDCLPLRLKGPGSEFMRAFESAKRNFGPSDEKTEYQLPLNMKVNECDSEYFDPDERLVFISRYDIRRC